MSFALNSLADTEIDEDLHPRYNPGRGHNWMDLLTVYRCLQAFLIRARAMKGVNFELTADSNRREALAFYLVWTATLLLHKVIREKLSINMTVSAMRDLTSYI